MKKYMRLKGNSSNKTMQNYVGTRRALSENKGITLVALVITMAMIIHLIFSFRVLTQD